MTLKEAYISARRALLRHACESSDSAREAELFVALAARVGRETIWAHPERALTAAAAKKLLLYIRRRLRHEPVEYITGVGTCRGESLRVTNATLIPRPATDLVIAAALAAARRDGSDLAIDVGTGSGAIALALSRELAGATVIATDTSAAALKIAADNAKKLGRRIIFKKGPLLEPARRELARARRPLIVANLPYIPTGALRRLPREIRDFEPRSALDGGKDGLDPYRALLSSLAAVRPTLIFEILPEQFKPLAAFVKKDLPGFSTGKIVNDDGICVGIEIRAD